MDEVGKVTTSTCCDHDKKCQNALKSLNEDNFGFPLFLLTDFLVAQYSIQVCCSIAHGYVAFTILVLFVFWLTRDESLELSNRTLFSFQEFRPLHVHGALESKVHPNILKQLDEVQERILEEVRIASGHLFGRH